MFNPIENIPLFDNKLLTYKIYSNYYHRDVCSVESIEDKADMDSFVSSHDRFIIKPIDSSGGRNVKIISKDDYIFNKLLNDYRGGYIAEQIVINSKELSAINSSSLNTVRIATVRTNKNVEIAFSFIRFGRNGKCVDNGLAGGLICNIDVNTGVITSAVDENAHYYIVHPESKKKIVGLSIPDWNDAIKLSKQLALVVPDNRYTGWDLAHTDNGWVMIEANCKGQFIGPQLSERKGIKKQFDSYIELINRGIE